MSPSRKLQVREKNISLGVGKITHNLSQEKYVVKYTKEKYCFMHANLLIRPHQNGRDIISSESLFLKQTKTNCKKNSIFKFFCQIPWGFVLNNLVQFVIDYLNSGTNKFNKAVQWAINCPKNLKKHQNS